jgi:hypothetical protein
MNALWSGFDGPRLVTDAAAEFHLADTVPTRIPGRWGSSVTTATDYATFLHALPAHLDDADRATLDGWMHATTPTAADGFDQDFGVLAPGLEPAGAVAAKQGWTCCVGGWRDLHSAGVLPDGRVVVALGAFPVSTSYAQAARTIDHAVADAVRHTG